MKRQDLVVENRIVVEVQIQETVRANQRGT